MAFTWNEQAGRFVGPGGRFVSESAVRAVIDQIADTASDRMAASATAMLEGRMSLAAFQADLMQNVRLSHVAAATIARGGAAQMSPSDWLYSAREIKSQYQYARAFAEQVASGEQPLNGTVASRAAMYGQHARAHFEQIRGEAAVARGEDEARNILHANESCGQCRSLAARGWMPASEMPAVGSRTCLSRCRCTVQRRRHPVDVAA